MLLAFLMGVSAVGSGCNYLQPAKLPETPKETHTKITKNILKERLGKKSVPIKFDGRLLKPNPLKLWLKFINGGDFPRLRLNSEQYEFDELVKRLNALFQDRENNGAFCEGANEVEKRFY